MKLMVQMIFLVFFLWAVSACSSQANTQATAVPATANPTETPTAVAEVTPTTAVSTGDQAEDETAALIWEGDPLYDDGQAECRRLQLTAEGQAAIGPCGEAGSPVELLPAHEGEWAEIVQRFAPFEQEGETGRLVFRGQGQVSGPAWQRALDTWARFTYLELASGRTSASGRTVLSWWLGEVPGQPGVCRQLVVLAYGYAYSNLTPCQGGQVQETMGSWLETAEWEPFDSWLYSRATLYQGDNYFSGLGSTEMSEAEAADLAAWAEAVYSRLRPEAAEEIAPTPAEGDEATAGCPEATADTLLLQKPEHGYCLLYPATYIVETPSDNATVLVIDSIMNHVDPRVSIEVTEAAGLTSAQAADQLLAIYSLPDWEFERTIITLGGEEAVVLDHLPGQDINRRVVVVHDDRLYSFMFTPANPDDPETYGRMEALYNTVANSFTFLPE